MYIAFYKLKGNKTEDYVLCETECAIGFSIFLVFISSLSNDLPKCKVAYYLRESYLRIKGKKDIKANIEKNHPLPYCYLQKGNVISFYYHKNDLITYYIGSMQNDKLRVIPLYNYVRNNYELILSDFPYDFKNHYSVCVVRAPNHQLYLMGTLYELDTISNPILIASTDNGTIWYNFKRDFSKEATYLFHSMPIANSFVLVVLHKSNEIVFHVVDLINETVHVQKCSVNKIIETILSLIIKNNRLYRVIKSIENLDELSFEKTVINNIDSSIGDLVFYDKCIVNISLAFKSSETNNKKILRDVLSTVATYKNNKLIVSLQINSIIKVKTSHRTYEIDFGASTTLTSNEYTVDNKYDISQSHLYSVIASDGNHTIISEHNIQSDEDSIKSRFVMYYKNKPVITPLDDPIDINVFNDILLIESPNKKLAFIKKHRLTKPNKMNKYYIEAEMEDKEKYIGIIDTEVLMNLILEDIHKSNNTSWVGIDTTNIMKILNLQDKLREVIRRYLCPNTDFEFHVMNYYIDCEIEEIYLLIWAQCFEKTGTKQKVIDWNRVYIFRGKIESLLSERISFKLVGRFAGQICVSYPNIYPRLNFTELTFNRIFRLFGNKWNIGDGLIDLKVCQMYNTNIRYYDYGYNRRSIPILTSNTSIASALHLVRRITQIIKTAQQ